MTAVIIGAVIGGYITMALLTFISIRSFQQAYDSYFYKYGLWKAARDAAVWPYTIWRNL